jgi:hypothetical protein
LNENERCLRLPMLMNITYKKNGMRVSKCELRPALPEMLDEK